MCPEEFANATLEKTKTLLEHISGIDWTLCDGHPNDKSAHNLLQYLKLRELDNTALQAALTRLGLSSLGRSQAHIADSLWRIINILSKTKECELPHVHVAVSVNQAIKLQEKRKSIFNSSSSVHDSQTSIMLTLPSQAACEPDLIETFAKAGVEIFRINTAHDDPQAWRSMAAKIKELQKQGLHAKIYVDLAGPKIRTLSIAKKSQPIKLRSEETVVLCNSKNEEWQKVDGKKIVVDEKFFSKIKEGEKIYLQHDDDEPSRLLLCESKDRFTAKAKVLKKAQLDENSILSVSKKKKAFTSKLHSLALAPQKILLHYKDSLFISFDEIEGHAAYVNDKGDFVSAVIACSYPQFAQNANVGEHIWLDDGKIGLVVKEKLHSGLLCEVTSVSQSGETLKEEKGVNFPETPILVDALTQEDRQNLLVAVEFADIIGMSFVQRGGDIDELRSELIRLGKQDTAIVAKIETKSAVRNLPEILLALLKHPQNGVMIARGDLAIELGFENLAYLQEEILDICEAAHIPVIFATQVLENQMKTGLPSRAEITDASYAARCDCVMLNKGPFALETIHKLEHILQLTHKLYNKNRQLLVACELWA